MNTNSFFATAAMSRSSLGVIKLGEEGEQGFVPSDPNEWAMPFPDRNQEMIAESEQILGIPKWVLVGGGIVLGGAAIALLSRKRR